MRSPRRNRKRQEQSGIALLISIFVLLLISVVAIALVVSSGTETALAGNYRSSTSVYYAALAGLEEARSRLQPKSPNYFGTTWSGFLPSSGTPLPLGSPEYLINPLGTENVAPWTSGSTYQDNEYSQEFASSGYGMPSSPPFTNSVWTTSPLSGLSFPGPLYKWVRINAVSEKSMNLLVAPYNSGPLDSTTPVYYDGTLNINNSGSQVLELTALAVLPNGSQKLLQYLVAPTPITLPPFLAALTLFGSSGNAAAFHAPASNTLFGVKGNDRDCSGTSTSTNYISVGVFDSADKTTVINGIPSGLRPNYTGTNSAPDVELINGTFPANLQNPSQMDALAQNIAQYADHVITPTPTGTPPYLGTATGSSLTPLGMSPTNPETIVVNGNLDISNWSNDGYGLLLVTGTFTYDPDTTWDGIILVIGQGIVNGSHMQYKIINGAMLVAKTRDDHNVLLTGPNMGGASMVFSDSMQGDGIRYSNCWIQKAQPSGGVKVLSFHEIAQ